MKRDRRRTLGLLSLGILAASFLLGVEPQVLQQEDLPILCVLDSVLDLFPNTVGQESNGLGEEFFQLLGLEEMTCGLEGFCGV